MALLFAGASFDRSVTGVPPLILSLPALPDLEVSPRVPTRRVFRLDEPFPEQTDL
jgi:hypothetical protein